MTAPARFPVRTMIVDDSPAMRAMLRKLLSADPDIEVIGTASETRTARALIKELNPDVLTLDVEMPGMNGIDFLEKIMRLRPMPVVMCSSLTQRGTDIAIEAMRLGAVDCIAKPSGGAERMGDIGRQLRQTVKDAARSQIHSISHRIAKPRALSGGIDADRVIAIGASTGGVEALFSLLSRLPDHMPPILVVQHMPGAFTPNFAARLDTLCAMRVVEAQDGQPVEAGTVYIAPGTRRHMILHGGRNGHIRLVEGHPLGGHRPAVDMLFHSCAMLKEKAVGILLTGMGADGAEGLLALRNAGARTFGQNEASCVIYGMPRAAMRMGAVEQELDLTALPQAVMQACRLRKGGD